MFMGIRHVHDLDLLKLFHLASGRPVEQVFMYIFIPVLLRRHCRLVSVLRSMTLLESQQEVALAEFVFAFIAL
jgi:hypothetical protein